MEHEIGSGYDTNKSAILDHGEDASIGFCHEPQSFPGKIVGVNERNFCPHEGLDGCLLL